MQHDNDATERAAAKPRIAVIGAGPAGLMAADVAIRGGADVTVYDRMASPGRKLLLAGRGGLNLTHSEDMPRLLSRFGEARSALAPLLERFGPADLRRWCAALGIETFVGTSGRVFPISFKTSPLLRAWLTRLDQGGVRFRLKHRWLGWSTDGRLRFSSPDGEVLDAADAIVLALGGASWPQLGADGTWVVTLGEAGIAPAALRPANCGFVAGWSQEFRQKFEGQPLKAVALSFGGERARGDAMITRDGLEGGPVYALAPALREAIAGTGQAVLHVALRPDVNADALAHRLGRRRPKDSVSSALRRTLGLSPAGIGLLRESRLSGEAPLSGMDAASLARLVNVVPVRLTAPMPIVRAISTAGGVRFADLDDALMMRRRAGVFVAGEMLDWEAPTGGYLLQGCFSTGVAAAEGALAWLAAARPHDAVAGVVEANVEPSDPRAGMQDVSALP